jgi:hypothetical protein
MSLDLFKVQCFDAFHHVQEKVLDEIRNLTNDYLLKASPTELEQHFIDKATFVPLTLHLDERYMEGQRPIQYEVTGDFNRAIEPGRRAYVAGTTIQIAVPYEGDAGLLRLRPSRFTLGPRPRDIDVKGDHLLLEFSFADDSASTEKLKHEIEKALSFLDDTTKQLSVDVANHNAQVAPQIREALAAKREKALKATNAVAGLGIPMKRSDAPTFAVPTTRRERPIRLPPVETGTFQPEPFLPDKEYDFILSVARNMSLVIERSPKAFATLDEEAIRNHFLILLNGHYGGQATGETFNAAGKTDILLRHNDRNVFIAECKFWTGPKAYNDAIDQLLGYLTWRDCKCALLIFNRNQDSTAVANKMHATLLERAEFRKTVTHDVQGDSRYVVVKATEPGREIIVTTQLYDVPNP